MNIDKLLNIVNIVDTLSSIPRVGWVQRGLSKFEAEDVGKHILLTSYVGLSLCCEYREICEDKDVNCDSVVTLCLIHDLHEANIGNISGNVRKLIPNFRQIELKQLEELLKDYPKYIRQYVGMKFLNYRESKSIEALITNIADKLSTLLRALSYYLRGYRQVIDLIHNYTSEVVRLLNYIKCSEFREEIQNILHQFRKFLS